MMEQQITKTLYLTIILCLGTTVAVANEVHYNIRPSRSLSQSCGDRYCNSNVQCMDNNSLTLSQFVDHSTEYLSNKTRLILSPGNYSLESELIVKKVHSFSMTSFVNVWSITSEKAIIKCGHNGRFEFRNASTVTISGLEFVGCFENNLVSVGHFQLENTVFLGNCLARVDTVTVLIIEDSTANLDRVTFLSAVENLQISTAHKEITESCSTTAISNTDVERVTGILLRSSNIDIIQSWFEGNNVGFSGIVYNEYGSNITIINSTFVNNSASTFANCKITGGIVYTNGYGSTVNIYNSIFVQNIGVLIYGDNSRIIISHAKFINNSNNTNIILLSAGITAPIFTGYAFLVATNGTFSIKYSEFINNTGLIIYAMDTDTRITHSEFVFNNEILITIYGLITDIDYNKFIYNTGLTVIVVVNTSVSISHSEFVSNVNIGVCQVCVLHTLAASVHHCRFINNIGLRNILAAFNTSTVSIVHSEFSNNNLILSDWIFYDLDFITLLALDAVKVTMILNEFINNTAGSHAIVEIPYLITADEITNNVFIDNHAAYDLYIGSKCRPGLCLSLGNSRCIQCSESWLGDLIGIVIFALVAGIAVVFFIFALNMTVAVGTLNGILFYANIVGANADTYFLPFTTPNYVTVIIAWLNLEIGFDICVYHTTTLEPIIKVLMQLVFPIYVIFLAIVVFLASEYSSRFAKTITKLGNPVAVLATLILVPYTRVFSTIIASFSTWYGLPASGSRKFDATILGSFSKYIDGQSTEFKIIFIISVIISMLILLFYLILTVLVFCWQWLLQYQDKVIFRWVRYQKLCHFLEPYHAPYTVKCRYWTGLLLVVRILLSAISELNFPLDPHVNLISVILAVGGLILLKGVIAKRVYKNCLLDITETSIYFNLVAFSALTWYNLDFSEGNQIIVAYISATIIFILFVGIIAFHILRYTRLYKCSFIEKAFKWTSSKLLDKKPKQEAPTDAPEELDGYWLLRSTTGDTELSTITHSVVEISAGSSESRKE